MALWQTDRLIRMAATEKKNGSMSCWIRVSMAERKSLIPSPLTGEGRGG